MLYHDVYWRCTFTSNTLTVYILHDAAFCWLINVLVHDDDNDITERDP